MSSPRPPRQGMLGGVLVTLLAEGIALPAGLLTAMALTRGLGPEIYGRFTVVATTVAITEWLLIAVLARAVVKFVAEADDWRPVAATSFRAYVLSGLAIGAIFWGLAGVIAEALRDPALAGYFRLFAPQIPVFAAGAACRNILAGQARYQQSAAASGVAWTARVTCIVLFVHLGWGIEGAILGSICGSAAGALVALALTGRAVWGRAGFPMRELLQLALPAFIAMLFGRLLEQVAILALRTLTTVDADVGYFGAAMNVFMVTGVVAAAITPVLISTLTAARFRRDEASVKTVSLGALRFGLVLFPMAAVVSGSSPEVVDLLFGAEFAPAGPLVALLVVAAVARAGAVIAAAVLIALGRAWTAAALAFPVPLLAVAAHSWVIPRYGALGAGWVTVSLAVGGAAVGFGVTCWRVGLRVPVPTVLRSGLIAALAFTAASAWPTPGIFVIAKMVLLGVAVVAALLASGELSREEIDGLRSALPGRG